jgi:CheY-like chemotaxis protein
MRPRMDGIEVTARIMPRPQYDLPLGEVKLFWQRWFEEAGADYGSLT